MTKIIKNLEVPTGNICTTDGYEYYHPYQLVFIPSLDEDKSRITCGNAILSDYKF